MWGMRGSTFTDPESDIGPVNGVNGSRREGHVCSCRRGCPGQSFRESIDIVAEETGRGDVQAGSVIMK
jgi:hypothetical protein